MIQAASWALKEEVTFDRDRITSLDWETYPVLGFDEIPEVETLLMDRPGLPSLGCGEATQGPTPAAIANAVFAAVGLRLRQIPFRPDRVRAAAEANRDI
jgi:CO/xanthine dehydrogenase Mo-binding subunit